MTDQYSPADLECSIFVEWSLGLEALETFLLAAFKGRRDGFYLRLPACGIHVRQNRPDGYPIKDRVFDAKYQLEISPRDLDRQQAYFDEIAKILTTLWTTGVDAAAITSFEEHLPENGGYSRSVVEQYIQLAPVEKLPPVKDPVDIYEPATRRRQHEGSAHLKSIVLNNICVVLGILTAVVLIIGLPAYLRSKPLHNLWQSFIVLVIGCIAFTSFKIALAYSSGQSFKFRPHGVDISDHSSIKTSIQFDSPVAVTAQHLPNADFLLVTLTYTQDGQQEQFNVLCAPDEAEQLQSLYGTSLPQPASPI